MFNFRMFNFRIFNYDLLYNSIRMKALKTVTTSLSSIILFCRAVDRTAGFYT